MPGRTSAVEVYKLHAAGPLSLLKCFLSCDHPNSENHLLSLALKPAAARKSKKQTEIRRRKKFQFHVSHSCQMHLHL